MSTGVTESREETFMPLVVALSALIVGMLLAVVPAMLIHDDAAVGIVDFHGDGNVMVVIRLEVRGPGGDEGTYARPQYHPDDPARTTSRNPQHVLIV
jgi:hypothetical protein